MKGKLAFYYYTIHNKENEYQVNNGWDINARTIQSR